MKTLTARQFVENQIPLQVYSGSGWTVEYGDYAVSTIRKAINSLGYRSEMDDCGNMYAVVPGDR